MDQMIRSKLWLKAGAVASGLTLVALVTVGVVGGAATAAASAATPLVGTFGITAGTFSGGIPAGSYFRMLIPGGTLNGPSATNYFANPDSTASDQTYTLLSPGTQGGLITGAYQAAPDPAFDGAGNSLAAGIIAPVAFAGPNFSVETQTPDAQTSTAVPTPTISDAGGKLTGSLQAFSASWNTQYFNQGSPKPDGSSPGVTAGPTGKYTASTGAYSLTWTSEIVGGPFNGFTGQWVLTGTFKVGAPTITTTSLPDATPGTAYSAVTLAATGGVAPYKWKVSSGTLPAGLKLSSKGVLSGTPKKTDAAGADPITVEATSHKSTATATKPFTLTVT
jgi:hypothetical protein